jgi:hypothetical protein
MTMKTTRYRKPNLLVLLTFFVGVGVLATSVAQAGELRIWKPEFSVGKDGRGLNLARPFGTRGPTLRLSHSLPDNVKRSLRAGGDHQIGAFAADSPNGYMFLEKRL